MAKVYFISVQYVKDNSIIDENVDEKYINIAIQRAQTNTLVYLIGTGLYNEIAGQITNGTLTALNTTLLDTYIAPALLSYTLIELTPYMLYKFSNRNVGVKDADKMSAVDYARMDDLMKRFEADAELSYKRLRMYVNANLSSYPLWSNSGSSYDTIYPRKETFTCDIFLGNKNKNIDRVERLKYPFYYGTEETD